MPSIGESESGRAVGVGHVGEFAGLGIIDVGGYHSPRPCAGGELSGGGVGVIGAFAVCVFLAGEESGGLVVNPVGGVAARGIGPGGGAEVDSRVAPGGEGFGFSIVGVGVGLRVVGFAPGVGCTSKGIIGAVAHLTKGVLNRLDLPGSVFHRTVIGEVGGVACGIRLAGDLVGGGDIGDG